MFTRLNYCSRITLHGHWPLKVVVTNVKLIVKGNQNDRIETGRNATDFALDSTQHIVNCVNLGTNDEVATHKPLFAKQNFLHTLRLNKMLEN